MFLLYCNWRVMTVHCIVNSLFRLHPNRPEKLKLHHISFFFIFFNYIFQRHRGLLILSDHRPKYYSLMAFKNITRLVIWCWCLLLITPTVWTTRRNETLKIPWKGSFLEHIYITKHTARLQQRHMGAPIHTEQWKVFISGKSHFLWTSYLMFWHRYPCKCSAQCLWILRALFCTWIVSVVGDHLILRR